MDYWNEIKIRSTRTETILFFFLETTETILGMQQERSLCWAVELRLCLVFFKTGWNGVERGGLKKTEQGFWFGDWVRWVEILYLGSRSFRASGVNLFRCLQGCPSQGKETEKEHCFYNSKSMETKLIQRRLSAYFFWAENSKKSGGLSCSLIFLFGRSLEVHTQLVQVQRQGSCFF